VRNTWQMRLLALYTFNWLRKIVYESTAVYFVADVVWSRDLLGNMIVLSDERSSFSTSGASIAWCNSWR
jgi:hypothetical protein